MTTIITIITIITTTIAMTITYTSFFFLTLLISAAIPIFSRTLKTNQRFEVSAGRLWECIDSGTSGDIDHLLHRMPAGGVLDVVDPGKIGRMTATPPGKDRIEPFKFPLPPRPLPLFHQADVHPAAHRLDHRVDHRIGEADASVIAVTLERCNDAQPGGCGMIASAGFQERQKLGGLGEELCPANQLVEDPDAGLIREWLQDAPVHIQQEPGDLPIVDLPENGHAFPKAVFILHGGDLQPRRARRLRAVTSDTAPARGGAAISSSHPRAQSQLAG